MAGKEFTWDEEGHKFIYKDKNRMLQFTGEDVQKWVSIESLQNGNPPCDIIDLRAGERITYRKCTGTKRRTRSLKATATC